MPAAELFWRSLAVAGYWTGYWTEHLAKILGWLVRLVVAERLTKVEIEVQLGNFKSLESVLLK